MVPCRWTGSAEMSRLQNYSVKIFKEHCRYFTKKKKIIIIIKIKNKRKFKKKMGRGGGGPHKLFKKIK